MVCHWLATLEFWSKLATTFLAIVHKNNTVCNWFCTLCLISGGQNRLALWCAEKGCWWFDVVCKLLSPFVVSKCDLFSRKRPVHTAALQSQWSCSRRVVWLMLSRSLNKRNGIIAIPQNGYDSLHFFSSSFIRWRNVFWSFQQSVNKWSFVALRVTRKEIEITVDVCRYFCKHVIEFLCRVYL